MRVEGKLAWWAFALSLVAGCNQIFGLDRPAGDDVAIDAGGRDAVDLDAVAGDRDGDGVPDGLDVCPDVADPGQFDEDDDGRGDRCDLCPHVVQTDDLDTDDDGVPDACDPLPGISGGRLRWNGFHDGAELDDFAVIGGGGVEWNGGDAAELVPLLDAELRFVRRDDDDGAEASRTRTVIIASMNVGAPNVGGGPRRAVGVITNAVGNDFFLCQIETDLPVVDVRLVDYRLQASTATIIGTANVGPLWPTNDDLQLRFELTGVDEQNTSRTASCKGSAEAGAASLPTTAVVDLPSGAAGVRVVGVPVRVHWIAIIDHP